MVSRDRDKANRDMRSTASCRKARLSRPRCSARRYRAVVVTRAVGIRMMRAAAIPARAGRRLIQRQVRPSVPTGRANTGRPARNRSRSSSRSAAVAYRSAGSFARALRITSSSAGGNPGLYRLGGSGVPLTCANINSNWLFESDRPEKKGIVPTSPDAFIPESPTA